VLEDEISDADYFNGSDFSMIDAIYAPIFRYHKRISDYEDYGLFEDAPRVKAWGERLLERPSVINSVSESYDEGVTKFLKKQNSILGNAMTAE
ncbi:MAG: glutathione S-transferase domain-containing protein, partial [Gammaproteobacteria bacterium]|nr:glutathione S-transferase domain-containing protein [Gammaproteobacteria bacterium]